MRHVDGGCPVYGAIYGCCSVDKAGTQAASLAPGRPAARWRSLLWRHCQLRRCIARAGPRPTPLRPRPRTAAGGRSATAAARVVGNLRRPPKTCHSSSESWENGDSEYVIRYAGKIRPFLKFQYLYNIRNYFFWPDLRRLPSQQTPNIWYVLVANMLESNPVVRNISKIHLRLHKLRCIPILTLHIQHGSHSPPPAASF